MTVPCASPPIWQQPEDVAQSSDQHKGKEYADQMASAAENTNASEQRDGDHVELEADRVVRPRIGKPRRKNDSGERRDNAACGEQRQPYAADANARTSARRQGCRRWRRCAADRALLQQDCENRRENEKRNDRPREDRSSTVSIPKSVKASGNSFTEPEPRMM